VAAAAALVLLIGGIGVVGVATHGGSVSGTTPGTASIGSGNGAGTTVTNARDAIVTITTYTKDFGPSSIIGGGTGLTPLGAGTGMILTSTGEVMTNNHVVQGAFSIHVQVPGSSKTYTASVLGVSPSADVALIQLEGASGLPTVTLGDASSLSVGDNVTAIGNALGRGSTTTTNGTVSGLDRSIIAQDPTGDPEHLHGLIQTNAPIVPGDSGGALVASNGEVVGMITAGSSSIPGQAAKVGFAIPVDDALGIVDQIRAGQESSTVLLGERGYLGVRVQDLTPALAAQLGFGTTSGAVVSGIDPGTPAETIGITAPAVITAIDGQPVTSGEVLGTLLHAHTPGEQVRVTWVDAHGTHTATVGLAGNGPAV
jgi:S1-C subfamily serine protease